MIGPQLTQKPRFILRSDAISLTWVPALVASGIVTVLAVQLHKQSFVTSLSHEGKNMMVSDART